MKLDAKWTDKVEFPAPIEGWVENYKETDFPTIVAWGKFPAPLEVWVGSYTAEVLAEMTAKGSFPAPREVWVGSYSEHYRKGIQWKVSVPSRGMGGFPQYYKRSKIP